MSTLLENGNLARMGIAGVAIAIITFMGFLTNSFFNYIENHAIRTTEALETLEKSVERLNYNLERKDVGSMLSEPVVMTDLLQQGE